MKIRYFLCVAFTAISISSISQTLYVPGGTIGNSGNSNVGIGFSSPAEKLHINGSIRGNQTAGALRVQTTEGYIDVGPKNGSSAHFYTDMPLFYFNQELRVNSGKIGSYDEDLELRVAASTKVTVNSSGYMGIGTTSPTTQLHVSGQGGIRIEKPSSTNFKASIAISNQYGPYGLRFCVFPDGDWYNYTEMLFLSSNGNVGIGSTNPNSKLTVKGNVRCSEVNVVQLSTIPDYVFAEDYELKPVEDIMNFVRTNKHLPEIPSEAEFKEEGMNLGEMNLLLLKKIEEQFLYISQLTEEVASLKEKVNTLEKNIK